MATLNLTDIFSGNGPYRGGLLVAGPGTTVTTQTNTTFAFTLPVDSSFAGFKITVTGSNLLYIGISPLSGNINSIIIADDSGAAVASIFGITANSLAADFALFGLNVFGWTDVDGQYYWPNSLNPWSTLLSGNDIINGTEGSDWRSVPGYNAGNDVFNMLGGDDFVTGGLGDDTINGGDGWDTLSFENTQYDLGAVATRGINVDVGTGVVLDCYDATDQVTGIEFFTGSILNDVFVGATGDDHFSGLRGRDSLFGGTGGNDHAYYNDDAYFGGLRGIIVNLSVSVVGGDINGTIRDGFGRTDTVQNIDSVWGTRFNDVFNGSTQQNNFFGGEGKDAFDGKGGAGDNDTIFFHFTFAGQAQVGLNIDLTRATGQVRNDGFGNIENAISIENVTGSVQADRIKGSTGRNDLQGWDGKDTLTGAGGADTFIWEQRDHLGDNDVITDFFAGGGANHDVLKFYVSNWGASTTLHLVNGVAATQAVGTFLFNTATDVLSWDEDGTGGIAAIAVSTLSGVNTLSAANFDLV